MKRSKRRVLAFLLCVFMLLGTGMSAMAGEAGTTGPDVENNHTVTPAVRTSRTVISRLTVRQA